MIISLMSIYIENSLDFNIFRLQNPENIVYPDDRESPNISIDCEIIIEKNYNETIN